MKKPALPRPTLLRIGQQLRAVLDPVVSEPLPAELATLLDRLRAVAG